MKFASKRDDLFWFMTLEGWATDTDGSVEFGRWFGKLSNTAEDVSVDNGEFNSLVDQWEPQDSPDGEASYHSEEFRASLVGHFLISEDSQGFVTVEEFDSELERDARYNELSGQYGDWLGPDGEDD